MMQPQRKPQPILQGVLKVGWPFRAAHSGREGRPLYPHIGQSLDKGHLRKGGRTWGEVALSS